MSFDIHSDAAAPVVVEVQRTETADSARAALARADYLGSVALEQLTGIPASTWRYWAINDTGPRSFKLGRRRVWRRADVLVWIEQQDAATGTGGSSVTAQQSCVRAHDELKYVAGRRVWLPGAAAAEPSCPGG